MENYKKVNSHIFFTVYKKPRFNVQKPETSFEVL